MLLFVTWKFGAELYVTVLALAYLVYITQGTGQQADQHLASAVAAAAPPRGWCRPSTRSVSQEPLQILQPHLSEHQLDKLCRRDLLPRESADCNRQAETGARDAEPNGATHATVAKHR